MRVKRHAPSVCRDCWVSMVQPCLPFAALNILDLLVVLTVLHPGALSLASSQQGHLHKGKHHRAGLPTLCSQDHFPWTNSVWHCAQAQERSYERFAQLPSVLLDWSILSSMLPLFSSLLIQLSFAAKLFWVHSMPVNGLFVIVSALSALFMGHGCTGATARILCGTLKTPRTDWTFLPHYLRHVYNNL